MTRRLRQDTHEGGLRLHWFASVETDGTQEHIEIRHGRRDFLSTPQDRFRFGVPTHLAIGRTIFLECRGKYRPARYGALEPCERLLQAATFTQRHAQMRFDRGFRTSAGGKLEWLHRLPGAPLHEVSHAEEKQGGRLLRIG